MKRQNGELKKGRPSNPNSSRQMRLKELEMKKKLNGGKMPLGRPKSKVEELEVVVL
jgi:ribonucleotide reductase alpha subunit